MAKSKADSRTLLEGKVTDEALLQIEEFSVFKFTILMDMAKIRYGKELPVDDFMEGAAIRRDGLKKRGFPERLENSHGSYRIKALKAILEGYDADREIMGHYLDGVNAQKRGHVGDGRRARQERIPCPP